jgi:hypothetical protein
MAKDASIRLTNGTRYVPVFLAMLRSHFAFADDLEFQVMR